MFRNLEEAHFQIPSPNCAPHQDFHGVSEFLMRRSGMEDEEMSDDGSQMMLGEKKRRLNLEQVRALEKSFELGNKLEPERKMQLARALGLQPRQVSVWFQNRRARWKTKQLEKDYDVLKRQLEALKADNDALKLQNKKLHTQIIALRPTRDSKESGRINLNKENEGSWSNGSENSCGDQLVNLNTISTDSTLHLQTTKTTTRVFPNPATGDLIQLLHGSSNSRPDINNHIQICQKFQNPSLGAPAEGFCSVFPGIEENPEFWPWSEQQNFH